MGHLTCFLGLTTQWVRHCKRELIPRYQLLPILVQGHRGDSCRRLLWFACQEQNRFPVPHAEASLSTLTWMDTRFRLPTSLFIGTSLRSSIKFSCSVHTRIVFVNTGKSGNEKSKQWTQVFLMVSKISWLAPYRSAYWKDARFHAVRTFFQRSK